jgi:hypothetical protein
MNELHPGPRLRARDEGIARLRRATRAVLFGATALVGVVAGLAAHSFPGHKARAAAVATRTVRQTTPAQQTIPAQQHVTTAAAPPAVTTTAAPPAVTTVAPVAVSGAT